MILTKEEYLKGLAEYHANRNVKNFYGSVELHFVDGKLNGIKEIQNHKPDNLRGNNE